MNKRLVKGKDKCLAGVCSGIAEYFDCDPTFIRIVWLCLALCGIFGFMTLLYVICIIIIPDDINLEP